MMPACVLGRQHQTRQPGVCGCVRCWGCAYRDLRLAAMLELQEILDQGLYSSASKKLQQAIYEDLLVAAQQRDR